MRGFHKKKGKKMSYDVNVLVNGNRCKQYFHKGRIFIEAKEGSEYVVEIKNNSWEKVLAVVSVDGLNVIDGEAAEDTGAGYVMDRYTAQKLYGFQYSTDKVATFKFGALGAKDAAGNPLGYAASKGDGSEKNAGVIGVRIWDEVPKPPPPPNPAPVYSLTASWSGQTNWACNTSHAISCSYSCNPGNWQMGGLYFLSDNTVQTTALSNPKSSPGCNISIQDNSVTSCCSTNDTENLFKELKQETDKASFDMETQWGQSRSYKVKETTFERREVVHSIDIYYASRESLIAMGIDLGTERRVSFPESFKERKYAKPPRGWTG